jgi:HSP20 family molecular chaperone IbpA
MSLFPRTGDFAPLFRLLDDYDLHRSGRTDTSIRSWAPRFDVRETKESYLLDGELPGVDQKDIDIEFSDPQTLVIKGRVQREYTSPEGGETQQQQQQQQQVEKQGEKGKPGHRFWVSERSVGEFHRSFNFPARVDQDNVKASLKNGVLSVVVPKAAPPTAKKITIE